jgi:hypothetical protein
MIAARRFGYRQRGLPVLAASIALPFIATAVTDRYSLPLRWLLVMYVGASIWILSRVVDNRFDRTIIGGRHVDE